MSTPPHSTPLGVLERLARIDTTSLEDEPAGQLRARLEKELARGVPVGDKNVPVYASIGLSVSSSGSLPADLLVEADIEMYRVKGTAPQPSVRRLTVHGGSAVSDKGRGDPPHARRRADRP